jgi:ribonuclease-3
MPQDPSDSPPEPSRPGVDPAVVALEGRLGCPLPDAAVALAALTHKSFVNEHRSQPLTDNERLEFLGDAVVDLAVAHRLMERFPDAREGDLSKLRASVVDEAGLAKMAREIGLGPLLRLGRGEELTGGREKASLLADAMEAVIAAVYLSGGLDGVLRLIDRFLGDAFASAAAGTLDRDFKTQFQELAQSRLRSIPRYRVVAEHGPDHSKTFEVELELRGEVVGRGSGRSKKDAEQSAAKGALEAVNGRVSAEPRTLQLPTAPTASPPESVAAAGGVEPVEQVEIAESVEQVEHVETADSVEQVEQVETAETSEMAERIDLAAAHGSTSPGEPAPQRMAAEPAAGAAARRTRVTKRRLAASVTTSKAKAKKSAGRVKTRSPATKRKSRAKR